MNMPEDYLRKLAEDVGYIRAKVDDIPEIKKRLDNVEDRVSHMLGWASGAGAILGLMGAYIKDWLFTKN